MPKLQRYQCRVTCSPEAVDDTLGHGQTLICHTAPAWPPPCSPVTSPILLSVGVFLILHKTELTASQTLGRPLGSPETPRCHRTLSKSLHRAWAELYQHHQQSVNSTLLHGRGTAHPSVPDPMPSQAVRCQRGDRSSSWQRWQGAAPSRGELLHRAGQERQQQKELQPRLGAGQAVSLDWLADAPG